MLLEPVGHGVDDRAGEEHPRLRRVDPDVSHTASSWARTNPGGSSKTASTSRVFCAVSATIAVKPWTPAAANALRSAWIPAPPPESEPAIVMQRGTNALPSPA